MKNFKIYKNFGKQFVSFALATTMMATMSGCVSKSNTQKESILSDTRVITFEDGHIDIAVENNYEYVNGWSHNHNHFKSIITGEEFSLLDCDFNIPYKYDIEKEESIILYLTAEEAAKLSYNELTTEDSKKIISRILTEHEEQKKVLTK